MRKIVRITMVLLTVTTIATAIIGCKKDETKDHPAASKAAPKDHPAH